MEKYIILFAYIIALVMTPFGTARAENCGVVILDIFGAHATGEGDLRIHGNREEFLAVRSLVQPRFRNKYNPSLTSRERG